MERAVHTSCATLTIFKIVLPILLVVCIVFRPCLLSALYLLYFFILPMVSLSSLRPQRAGIYIKSLIVVSGLSLLLQIIFQIIFYPDLIKGLEDDGKFCSDLEELLRHIGFVKMSNIDFLNGLKWLSPEFIAFTSSLIIFITIKKLAGPAELEIISSPSDVRLLTRKRMKASITIMKFLVIISLLLAAVLRPSIQGGIYLLIFLSTTTWWACGQSLGKKFAGFMGFVAFIIFLHILALFFFQMQWPQSLGSESDPYFRYTGINFLINYNCTDPRITRWSEDADWDSFLNPFALLWAYYITVTFVRLSIFNELLESTPSERFPRGNTQGLVRQDSRGNIINVILTEELGDNDLIENQGDEETDEPENIFEKSVVVIESLIQLLIRYAYIFTNITMMIWAITFINWLGFIFLLLSNILWLFPNQRRSTLRSSPFLVLYLWFLLLSAYIYSMNLTEEELPQTVDSFDLDMIGFTKVLKLPCKYLLLKSLYGAMFWITLRQFTIERGSTADIPSTVRSLKIKSILIRVWIWIVVLFMFGIAITGQRMTLFRILYMALVLLFLLTFQTFFKVWKKTMFVFWIVVILYSMMILILVYTYQFKNVQSYFWYNVTKLTEEDQLNIGLETFAPQFLFVRLATPTCIVIFTAIQLHYFHKEFIALLDQLIPSSNTRQSIGNTTDNEATKPVNEEVDSENSKTKLEKLSDYLKTVVNFILLFLEIHFPKIIIFMAFLMFTYDKCALYMCPVILMLLGVFIGKRTRMFMIYITSVFCAVFIILKMVYQTQDFDPDEDEVPCPLTNGSLSTSEWLGFYKTSDSSPIYTYVAWNIWYIFAVTLMCSVDLYQRKYMLPDGSVPKRATLLFPDITRYNADESVADCLKYLLNYGFYKFGFEICLIFMAILISVRLDVYALYYAIWLCVLTAVRRPTARIVVKIFFLTLIIIISIQYISVAGLPPELCKQGYWFDSHNLTVWLYGNDFVNGVPGYKWILDVVLFILIAQQDFVFQIETEFTGRTDYPGGSNDSVIHHADEPDFVNPIPDFITYCRSYLDIIKRVIFLSWMWISLAMLFLAGTSRVGIYSLGYLIGSYIFLWQGSELYLYPIPRILCLWDWLLAHNLFVLTIRTAFQLVGCVYYESLHSSLCWLVQLFAIGCANQYITTDIQPDSPCYLSSSDASTAWDAVVYTFLILQRRIFNSYYLFHVINETKATTILASRGAELIEELNSKRTAEQEATDSKIVEKIKYKMEQIKARQQKIKGLNYKDTENHHVDTIFPGSRPMYRTNEPKSHTMALRSGDYYMFDELDDEGLDLIEDVQKSIEEEEEEDEEYILRRTSTIGLIGGPAKKKEVVIDSKIKLEPQPGTSRAEDDEISDSSITDKRTTYEKILEYLTFAKMCFESGCVSLALILNKHSRDYRYILRVLNREKKILKEKSEYHVGLRLGSKKVWTPSASYQQLVGELDDGKAIMQSETYEPSEMSVVYQPRIITLLLSIWHIILSHSHFVCYLIIFLNLMRSATCLSLLLPIFVFCWGSLSLPMPSKTFWVTIIAYTEVIVLIKCMFQFELIPWNKRQNLSPIFPPRLIGIERQPDYAFWDLLVLLVVFFHRYLLKSLGLWKSIYVPAVVVTDDEYHLVGNELIKLEKTDSSSIDDDDHGKLVEAQVEDPNKQDINTKTSKSDSKIKIPASMKLDLTRYQSGITRFFALLFDPACRITTDVYAYMFLCDFFNFFVILLGYSSFGPHSGNVSDYLSENRVPALFVIMLITQFILIVIDRAIYLRRNLHAKVTFQYLQVLFLHIWLFILYPVITDRSFNSVIAPQLYYTIKCIYLLLSAYQIRSGYPMRILGNFLCKGYNYVNLFLYKGFLAVPFLFELRMVMDWMWTDTSMTIFDWMKMEDIYSHIFQVKCNRYVEAMFPQPRGEKKPVVVKYLMGLAALVCMFAIIWFPLVFFSLGDAVGSSNIPYSARLELRIGPYEPIYQMTAQSASIKSFTEDDYNMLVSTYDQNKEAATFLSNYQPSDIAVINFSVDSASMWDISPPDRQNMVAALQAGSIPVILQYFVSHKSNTKEDPGTFREEVVISLDDAELRMKLHQMLIAQVETEPIRFENLIPQYVKVTNKGTAKAVPQLVQKPNEGNASQMYRNVLVKRKIQNGEWWQIQEDREDIAKFPFLKFVPYYSPDYNQIYTFNDKLFPQTLNFITGGGIIGLYTTIVLVLGRLLRTLFSGVCFKIMFDDLPYVDRVLQLCYDVYLVRETREYPLEEDLFAKLIFLFRSPETLIKWTRPKEEIEDEKGDDNEDGNGDDNEDVKGDDNEDEKGDGTLRK